jgi:hypothetical protein
MITLRDYQIDIVARGKEILRREYWLYLAMEMRTGKTLTALSIINDMGFRNPWILSKKNALPNILTDIDALNPKSKPSIVTNYENVKSLVAKLKAGTIEKPDIIVLDEAHTLGAFPKPGKTWKLLQWLCHNRLIIFMSGTPTPESYSQIYHQLNLSSFSPLLRYKDFYRFADEFVDKTVTIKVHGQDIIKYHKCDGKKLWPHIKKGFITFSQKDAGFKSDIKDHFLTVDMSPKCVEIYRTLKRDKIYINEKGHAAICNGGAQMMNKLWQISSGTLLFDETVQGVINYDGEVIDASKASFIRSFFFGKKIAIFYKFKAEENLLKMFFPNWTNDQQVFNSTPDSTFIGQIQSASKGVNISSANALVYYNLDFSAEVYYQSRQRLQHFLREGTCDLYFVFSKHGIERMIFDAVSNKQNFTYSYYLKAKQTVAA